MIIQTNDGRLFRVLPGGTDVAFLAVRVVRAAGGLFRDAARAAPGLIRRAGCTVVVAA